MIERRFAIIRYSDNYAAPIRNSSYWCVGKILELTPRPFGVKVIACLAFTNADERRVLPDAYDIRSMHDY
jgi:hypothetical protein